MKHSELSKEYILSRVIIDTVGWCWHWPQKTSINGYKSARFGKGRSNVMLVHRASYMAFVGPIPDGMVIDHLCRNRACCNPDHLEAVEFAENIRRGARSGVERCKYGHQYTSDNLIYQKSGNGKKPTKMCRTCRNERFRKYRASGSAGIKESKKKYREKNSEKIKEAHKKWLEKNPDYYKNRKKRRAKG